MLDIKKAGSPVLKEVAKPVDFVNKRIRKLLDEMAETMYESEGVGLAAPQVGESIRVIVCDDGNGLIELINPVITERSDTEELGLEGCLSVPGYFGDVMRSEAITVEAINRNNKKITIKAEGFLARIFQHEIDHLNGILFIEKTDTLRQG